MDRRPEPRHTVDETRAIHVVGPDKIDDDLIAVILSIPPVVAIGTIQEPDVDVLDAVVVAGTPPPAKIGLTMFFARID